LEYLDDDVGDKSGQASGGDKTTDKDEEFNVTLNWQKQIAKMENQINFLAKLRTLFLTKSLKI
jgi:hypothetical protein